MSGLAAIILTAIALFYPESFNGKYLFGIASFICAILAGYFVWRKTYPDLKIEIQECLITKPDGKHFASVDSDFVILHICITNLNANPNSIKSYELVLDVFGEKIKAEPTYTETYYYVYSVTKDMVDLIENRSEIVLPQGQYRNGWLCFRLPNDRKVTGCKFVLLATDAYGVTHKVKGYTPLDYETDMMRSKPAMDMNDSLYENNPL